MSFFFALFSLSEGCHGNNPKCKPLFSFFFLMFSKLYILSIYVFGPKNVLATLAMLLNTVDSRYLEIEGTLKNSSRYPYFDISDL